MSESIVDRGTARCISLVVPCFNEAGVIGPLVHALRELAETVARETGDQTEFVLVDDGSRDSTWEEIAAEAKADPRVRGFRLSRNFGHQAALSCGYRMSRGDAIVCLDADLQDPPAVVLEMVRAWRAGADVVFGVRSSRVGESRFKIVTADLYYWLLQKLGSQTIRANCGDFRLLGRPALEALLRLPERRPFFRGLVDWIGFQTAEVRYDRAARYAGQTKYSLRKMLQLAGDGLIARSYTPLSWSWWSAGLTVFALLPCWLGGWLGWWSRDATFLATCLCLVATLILLGQGVQSAYLLRIAEDTRGRPLYLVAEAVGDTLSQPSEAADDGRRI